MSSSSSNNSNKPENTNCDRVRRGGQTVAEIEANHRLLPKPLGYGQEMSIEHMMKSPAQTAMVMAISNRISRGVIPFPTADLRCSYCLTCSHDPEKDPRLKCSRCKKVLYCDKECQRYVMTLATGKARESFFG